MRRWMLVLLMAAIVAATAWTLGDRYTTRSVPDPWRAIPGSAAVIVEVRDPLNAWDRWTHSVQLWEGSGDLPAAAAIDALIGRIAERAEKDAALRRTMESSTLLVALVPQGSDDVETLIVWSCGSEDALRTLADAIGPSSGDLLGEGLALDADTALGTLHLAWSGGIARVSTSRALLEEAAIAMKSGAVAADSALLAARATLGAGADAHVLAHGGRLPQMLGSWFDAGAVDALLLPPTWAALDAQVRAGAILLSGVLFTPPDDAGISLLAHQARERFMPSRVLPMGTALLRSFDLSDPQRWMTDVGLQDDSIAQALLSWVNGPVILAEAAADSGRTSTWAVMQGDDPLVIARSLAALCPTVGPCDTLQYRGQLLVHPRLTDGFERAFGPWFSPLEDPWYAVITSKAVFSHDPDALRASIDAWLDGTALADDLAATELVQRYSGSAATTIWCDIGPAMPLLRSRSRADDGAAFDPSKDPWRHLGGILLQCSPGPGDRAFLSISVQCAPRERAMADDNTVWSAMLPAPLARKPDLLRNHSTGARDILVQDGDHTIHVFSSSGQLRWSRSLDGPILGTVHQVDRYRNGKLQLLFNTASQLHLIDRNGKDVEGFPITLKEKATAPLAVFDYEDKRDYRILIPTDEARVINIGIDGLAVEGWEMPRLPHTTAEPVRHFRVRSKDHLLLVDGAGGLHVWDRRGAARYKPGASLPGFKSVVEVRPALDLAATTIIWTDSSGALLRTSLGGSTDHIKLPLRSVEQAVPADLPNGPVLIATSGDSLVVISDGGDPLLVRSFDAAISAPPLPFDLGQGAAIGIVCASTQELYVVTLDGNDLGRSPFTGNTPFSIADLDGDGQWELIAGDRSGRLVVHRLAGTAPL